MWIKQQPIMSLSINKQSLLSQPIIAKTEDPTSFAFNPKSMVYPSLVLYRKDSHRFFVPANGYISFRYKLLILQRFSRGG